MRLVGRSITLLLMLAPAALTAYVGGSETTWFVAAGILLLAGVGADLALIATWRGEHAYTRRLVAARPKVPDDARRREALNELSGDLALLARQGEVPAAPLGGSSGRRDLVLTKPGRNRIAVIKEVRALRGCGLREAKEIVDGAARTPAVLAVGLPSAQARRLHRALTAAGATAELRQPGTPTG